MTPPGLLGLPDETREALGTAVSILCALESLARLATITEDADLVRQTRAAHGAAARTVLRLKAAIRARRTLKAAP